MRRIVLSLAACFALSACSGGGSVFSTGSTQTADRTIVTVAGASNIARVLAGAGIAISAVSTRGSQNAVISNNQFTWSAAVTTGQQYVYNTVGNTRACASITYTSSAPGSAAVPYSPDFSIYVTIDPSNEANVIFSPPVAAPAAAGGTVALVYPYCVAVSATPVGGGGGGTLLVTVVNPQAPLAFMPPSVYASVPFAGIAL